MRHKIVIVGALVIVSLMIRSARAETEVEVSGQVRVRSEIDKKRFDPLAASLAFTDMRTRVAVEAIRDGNAHVFVQFQDSRRWGGQTADGKDASGGLENGRNVDVHQAFVQLDRAGLDRFGIKIGRFEFNLGNQRVFGSVGWHNVGRVWEGGQAWYDGDRLNLTGFWLKRRELNDTLSNRDYDVVGAQLAFKEQGVELFGVYEYNADRLTAVGDDVRVNALDRISIGLHARRQFGRGDFECNAVYQTGNQRNDLSPDDYDIAAFLITGELGITINADRNSRLALAVDLASGDDNPADDKIKAYDNLYYTGHKFRGYMDYFLGSGPRGLVDVIVRGRTSLSPTWTAQADVHYFTTAQNYAVADGDSKAVGVEIDAGVATTAVKGVTLVWGGSIFLPSEDYAGADQDPGLWVYSMLTMDF